MNKRLLFGISIALSIPLTFPLSMAAFGEIIEFVDLHFPTFIPNQREGVAVFIGYGFIATILFGMFLMLFHRIILKQLREYYPYKVITLTALFKRKKLVVIFVLVLLVSGLGAYRAITGEVGVYYYIWFYPLFPLCMYILLNFLAAISIERKGKLPSSFPA